MSATYYERMPAWLARGADLSVPARVPDDAKLTEGPSNGDEPTWAWVWITDGQRRFLIVDVEVRGKIYLYAPELT